MNAINGLMQLNNGPNRITTLSSANQGNGNGGVALKQEVEALQAGNPLNNVLERYSVTDGKESRELTLRQKLEVKQLEQLERSVREHERAHLRAAQNLAIGSPSFEYKVGPDGQKYAVGGEVNIDASPAGKDPEETITKALKIQRAALAPSDPSPEDLQVATQARIMEAKAHRKLSRKEFFETNINKNQEIPGEIDMLPRTLRSAAVGVYRDNMNYQENLFLILDLFA
jgi:hypothetical protein